MKRLWIPLALAAGLPLSAAACLWDRDTPVSEARGMPEVVDVITGRFVKNPPLFHEMRLDRVVSHLQIEPADLAAYDDAGVACDRLGRGDQAVAWMEKKRARLETLDAAIPDVKDHWYRYHANIGTFLVHRWARNGSDRAKLEQVKAARDEIAKALEINPDAHFGREKYQLTALEWILSPPKSEGSQYLPNLLGWPADDIYGTESDPKEAEKAVRGLSGLIVLGNAWESVDIFNTLSVALQRDSVGYDATREGGRNSLGYFAWLRCRELIDAGKTSMLPDAPKGDALKSLLCRPDFVKTEVLLDPVFHELRAEADSWQAERDEFMLKRLNEGKHPDTDPTFWNGYKQNPPPALPMVSVPDAYRAWNQWNFRKALAVIIGVPVFVLALSITIAKYFKSRHRNRLSQVPPGRI